MITKKCPTCGKVLEGYTQNQMDYMLDQHNLIHKYKKEKIKETIPHPKEEVTVQDEKEEKLAEQRKRFLEE